MKRWLLSVLAVGCCMLCSAAPAVPTAAEMKNMIRKDHPRLFLNQETLPAMREYAKTTAKADLEKLLKQVDAYPMNPQIEYKNDVIEIKDGKLIFKKKLNDQDAGVYGVKTNGGVEALECALAWVLTGKEEYRKKAYNYMLMLRDFCAWSDQYKVLPDWYHYTRMCAFIAYDWLYNALTPAEREAFIVPMLKHVKHMQNPGYMRNGGGPASGNYGEPGLQWYAGVVAVHDTFEPGLADELFKGGYDLNVAMMNLREQISEGSGVLTSICSGYSFGAYPWSSYNFLHTLRSAANFDGVKIWPQMRDYANWFSWAIIPQADGDLCDYGWGDAFHQSNQMNAWQMYTHLAQAIHFFGDSDPIRAKQARAIQQILPERDRGLRGLRNFPALPFVLTGFDPKAKNAESPAQVLDTARAAHFPSYGLTVMRSGFTPESTFASFRGGAKFDQHQHYDENSFIIFKKGFQALDTGSRGWREHHLVYYPQTVAHNAILIRMDDEPLANYWYPANGPKVDRSKVKSDGGQFRTRAARSLGFVTDPLYAACGADATRSYSPEKCREAVRQFVYLAPDVFVVYDRVTSVKPDQEKVFLLHTQNEPAPLKDGVIRSNAGEGSLFIKPLLPQQTKIEVVGGPGKEFWTNGQNWPFHGYEKLMAKPNWQGRYRLEIKPAAAAEKARFLTVLQAADGKVPQMLPAKLITTPAQDGAEIEFGGKTYKVMFNRDGMIGAHLTVTEKGKVILDKPVLETVPVVQQDTTAKPQAIGNPNDLARLDLHVPGGVLADAGRGNSCYWEQPRWFVKGTGVLAQFAASPTEWRDGNLAIKSNKDGVLRIALRGPDVRKDGKFLPVYVEYAALSANGKALIAKDAAPVKVWHNAGKVFDVPVKAGETVTIRTKYRMAK